MWTLIKGFFYLVVFACLAVAAYVVPIDDKTLVEHAQDIWSSDVVQKKVTKVKSNVEGELAERVKQARAEKPKSTGKKSASAGIDQVTEADKKSLDTLIEGLD